MKKNIKYRPGSSEGAERFKRAERREIIFEIIFYTIMLGAVAGVVALIGGLL